MSKHTTTKYITSHIFLFIMIFSFIFTLSTPLISSAQITPKLENVIILDVTPSNPGPREQVTISAESFSIDLNTATISWFINGALKQQSIGVTSFQFTTGDLGSSTKVDVAASINDTIPQTKQITIRPTDADIVWQGNTYVHPLYRGKRIPSVGSTINVEVIPYFVDETKKQIATDALIYLWRIDGKTLPKASGRGKNTIIISQIKPVKSIFVEVEISTPDKLLYRKERLSIPVRDSELLVYENNPLLGILFNKTIKNLYGLTEQETKLIAYPFFMSITDRNSPYINYIWKLNNKPITLGEDRSSITVSNTNKEEGKATIKVSVQNSRDIFQRSSIDFIIEFGGNTSSGFNF